MLRKFAHYSGLLALWQIIQSVFGAPSLFATIGLAAGGAAMIWGTILYFIQDIEPESKVLYSIGLFCFLAVFIRFAYDRWQKHSVERIPDLVDKLDTMIWDYIDNFEYQMPENDWAAMVKEYGQLLGMDFHRFITATLEQKQDIINEEFEKISKAYNRKLNTENKMVQTIGDLRDMGELLNKYDIGLYLLPPMNFNQEHALPNKFFEFIQARLAIAIGPSSEMTSIVEKYDCGIVSKDFEPENLASKINSLSTEKVRYYKQNSHKTAQELNSEVNYENIKRILAGLVD